MDKNIPDTVRSHLQEREWLKNLGNGNVVAAVAKLLRLAKEENEDNHLKTSRKKSSRRTF